MDKHFHRVKYLCNACGIEGGGHVGRGWTWSSLCSHKLQQSLGSRLSSGTEDEIKFTSMCRFLVSSMQKEKELKSNPL